MGPILLVANPKALAILATEKTQNGVLLEDLHIKLQLLYPLADPEMLALCRNPDSCYSRDPAGNRCGRTNHEYLNITALISAWRDVWAKFPTSVSQVTFDTSLPGFGEGKDKVYWDQGIPDKGGIAVLAVDVARMVIGLATVMSVRSHQTVPMDVIEAMPKIRKRSAKHFRHDLAEICRRLSKPTE